MLEEEGVVEGGGGQQEGRGTGDWILPEGHEEQVDDEVAPVTAEYLPASTSPLSAHLPRTPHMAPCWGEGPREQSLPRERLCKLKRTCLPSPLSTHPTPRTPCPYPQTSSSWLVDTQLIRAYSLHYTLIME